MADRLRALADAHGILPAFTDVTGERRETGDESRRALLAAMGIDLSAPSAMDAALSEADPAQRRLPRWQVLRPGQGANLPLADDSEWRILREDGRSHEGRGPALPGLPLGRHRLTAEGETCWLLCAPPRLPLPPRCWGLIAPLAGLRTAAQGGIGDYGDLARLATGAAQHGAAFLGINPVHAGFLTDPAEIEEVMAARNSMKNQTAPINRPIGPIWANTMGKVLNPSPKVLPATIVA